LLGFNAIQIQVEDLRVRFGNRRFWCVCVLVLRMERICERDEEIEDGELRRPRARKSKFQIFSGRLRPCLVKNQ